LRGEGGQNAAQESQTGKSCTHWMKASVNPRDEWRIIRHVRRFRGGCFFTGWRVVSEGELRSGDAPAIRYNHGMNDAQLTLPSPTVIEFDARLNPI